MVYAINSLYGKFLGYASFEGEELEERVNYEKA
jgi:hypothetical protein